MSINKSLEDAQEAKNYFNYYIKDLGKIFNKVIGQSTLSFFNWLRMAFWQNEYSSYTTIFISERLLQP
jgi:hypothetical protein